MQTVRVSSVLTDPVTVQASRAAAWINDQVGSEQRMLGADLRNNGHFPSGRLSARGTRCSKILFCLDCRHVSTFHRAPGQCNAGLGGDNAEI
jgi:hypothetical protein